MDLNRDISEFNGAQLKLFRIDEAIRGIVQSRHQLNLREWLSYLQDFDMELESVKTKEEVIKTDEQLKRLADKINRETRIKKNPRLKTKSTNTDIIDSLNDFQKALLNIYKKSGLELKLAQDSMSGFGKT